MMIITVTQHSIKSKVIPFCIYGIAWLARLRIWILRDHWLCHIIIDYKFCCVRVGNVVRRLLLHVKVGEACVVRKHFASWQRQCCCRPAWESHKQGLPAACAVLSYALVDLDHWFTASSVSIRLDFYFVLKFLGGTFQFWGIFPQKCL